MGDYPLPCLITGGIFGWFLAVKTSFRLGSVSFCCWSVLVVEQGKVTCSNCKEMYKEGAFYGWIGLPQVKYNVTISLTMFNATKISLDDYLLQFQSGYIYHLMKIIRWKVDKC